MQPKQPRNSKSRVCPGCQRVSPASFRFCPSCGARLGDRADAASQAAQPGAPRHARPPDRRQITVLFCDLVESTAIAQRLDAEEMRLVLREYIETCEKVVARFGGWVAKYVGDGIDAYFGWPEAHEDDARRAVLAGLGILEALKHLNSQNARSGRPPIRARIGSHTGEVVVGAIGESGVLAPDVAVGIAPVVAARLQQIARPGTLVVSGQTYEIVRPYFDCRPLGSRLLKGVAAAIETYQVRFETGIRKDVEPHRQSTPLVGRERESSQIFELWADSARGTGRLALVSGEPGIGKTRLIDTLKRYAADSGAWVGDFACSPYFQNTPLFPIVDRINKDLFGDERPASHEDAILKVEGLLAQMGMDLPRYIPLMASLLSLPLAQGYLPDPLTPQELREATAEMLGQMAERRCDEQPILIVLEDLQWSDPSTRELLWLVSRRLARKEAMIAVTYRDGFELELPGDIQATSLSLSRLHPDEAEMMIGALGHSALLSPDVVLRIVEKADGIPLFIEQLARMLVQPHAAKSKPQARELKIPATLRDLLTSRLDALGDVRDVAQFASALGRRFSSRLIGAIWPGDADKLADGLRKLADSGLMEASGSEADDWFEWSHALIRDAAYQSLTQERRRDCHMAVATGIAEKAPDIRAATPELLAQHYTQAGQALLAIPLWAEATMRALLRSALTEAEAHARAGLSLLPSVREEDPRLSAELALLSILGPALIGRFGFGDIRVGHCYRRASEIVRKQGGAAPFPVIWGMFAYYILRAETSAARDLCLQMIKQAGDAHDEDLIMEARVALSASCFFAGEFSDARDHAEEGLTRYDPAAHRLHGYQYGQDPGVVGRAYLALSLWLLGYPQQALQQMETGLNLAEQVGHPFSAANILVFASLLRILRREWPQAAELAGKAIALARNQELAIWVANASFYQGIATAHMGDPKHGVQAARQGLSHWEATGARLAWPCFAGLLAECYADAGNVDEGFTLLEEATAAAARSGERWWDPELLRLRALLLTREPDPDYKQAQDLLEEAVSVARRQGARSLALRSALDRHRLMQSPDTARELSLVHAAFSEGFDTADLREARLMLNAIAEFEL